MPFFSEILIQTQRIFGPVSIAVYCEWPSEEVISVWNNPIQDDITCPLNDMLKSENGCLFYKSRGTKTAHV